MNNDVINTTVQLANENKWWAVAALAIGFAIRALKSDRVPFDIPPKWRPWLAMALGMAAGVVDKIEAGAPWKNALTGGFVAGLAAISGHQLFVESVRGGRELGESKESFKKRSLPPPTFDEK